MDTKKKKRRIVGVVLGIFLVSGLASGYLFLLRDVKAEFYSEDGSLFSVQTVKPFGKISAVHLASTEDKVFLGWFEDPDNWDSYFLFAEKAWRSVKLYPKFVTPEDNSLTAEQQSLYDEVITEFAEIPKITIETESDPNIQKPLYAKGKLSLDCANDEFDLSNVKMETRLRGRNSLGLLKKSYKVKFDKKAASVFGQSGNKNWALVANYIDISNLRNYLAYTFASTLSFEFSPNCYFVNLTMNGEEMGLYLLVESIEASPVRVDLQENPTAADFDTGFILEETNFITESNFVENLDYIEVGGHLYEIQYPKIDDDDIDPSNYGMIILYIKGYVASVHDAIFGGDFNRFEELCDVESFVDFMVVQETFKNLDAYMASCYFHKKPGGKLTMGPVWDFDRSVGSYDAYDLYYADGIYAEKHGGGDGNWFYSLWKTPKFKTLFKERVLELYETEMKFLVALVEPTMFYIYDSATANFEIWNIETALRDDAKHTLKDLTEFGEQCGFVKYFLSARIEWLYEYSKK